MLTGKEKNMSFQIHRDRYLQNIQQTRSAAEATPELSLFPHLQKFLEALFVDCFDRDTVRLTQEPRGLNQIGETGFYRHGRAAAYRVY